MKPKWLGFVAACAVLVAWAVTVQADPPPLTLWGSQMGTSTLERGNGIAVDGSGNGYITGRTEPDPDLPGSNESDYDGSIVKFDSAGTVQWTRHIGSSEYDSAQGIAVDGSGNSYITGWTIGDLGGPFQGGLIDAFIVACDSGGTVQWSRQIGTSSSDSARGIAVDGSGNSYITGYTSGDLGGPNQGWSDAFIVKHDSGGTVQWARQIGTSETDRAYGIAVDGSGNIYITGNTRGDLGGPNQGYTDAFVVACDSAGTVQWMRQIGSSTHDLASGIAVDGSGNIYITGYTDGDLGGPNQGSYDAFIVKCDSGGTVQWTRQMGTSAADEATGIAVDGAGNIYITGYTDGDLGGPNEGDRDGFIVACDSGGTVQWMRQIGTSSTDWVQGIAVDGSGNSYITGYTRGDLGGPYQGGAYDAFVVAIGTQAAPVGDATLDGCVDGLDYVVWSSNCQTGTWWVQGDFNEDGIVDGLDYVLWSSNYKVGCPASPGAVPEPSSALVLILGICALRHRRAGRRS